MSSSRLRSSVGTFPFHGLCCGLSPIRNKYVFNYQRLTPVHFISFILFIYICSNPTAVTDVLRHPKPHIFYFHRTQKHAYIHTYIYIHTHLHHIVEIPFIHPPLEYCFEWYLRNRAVVHRDDVVVRVEIAAAVVVNRHHRVPHVRLGLAAAPHLARLLVYDRQ